MIPETHFFRRLPICVDAVERLRLETLVFCHDLMFIALSRVRAVAANFDLKTGSDAVRMAMIGDCWQIVDQAYMALAVIRSMTSEPGPITSNFITEAEPASQIRNRMRHIHQNFKNRAAIRDETDAMFGTVSFVKVDPAELNQAKHGDLIKGEMFILAAGSTPADQGKASASFSTYDAQAPVFALTFSAFDSTIRLDKLTDALAAFLIAQEKDAEAAVIAGAPAVAAANNLPVEKVLGVQIARATGYIQLTFPYGPSTPEEI